MEKQFDILHYGISHVSEEWAFSLSRTSFIDRIYYILQDGAGYIEKGVKKYFIKNHIYIINHSADIKYFVDDYKFCHAFIDYTSADLVGYDHVLDIFPQCGEILKADADAMLCYLGSDEVENKKKGSFHPYSKRLMMILESILLDVEELYQTVTVEKSVISDAVRYIHKNYDKLISVDNLAKSVHLSKNQFSRLFLNTTGKTPYQYIKEYRFDMAISMIEKGMTIAETSAKCGFLSTSAFSNSFKKSFGFSPGKLIHKKLSDKII